MYSLLRNRNFILGIGVLLVLQVLAEPVLSVESTVVLPNGMETMWGNGSVGISDPCVVGDATQQGIVSAQQFSALPGPVWLTRIALRQDESITEPTSFVYHNFTMRLSTTQTSPLEMDPDLQKNIGPDETLVFSGDWSDSTDGAAALDEFRFDGLVFQDPFYYDPCAGNLVVHMTWSGFQGPGKLFLDYQVTGNNDMFAIGDETGISHGGWWVGKLFYHQNLPVCGDAEHPYPVGDLNGDCIVNMEDFLLLLAHWLEDTNPTGI